MTKAVSFHEASRSHKGRRFMSCELRAVDLFQQDGAVLLLSTGCVSRQQLCIFNLHVSHDPENVGRSHDNMDLDRPSAGSVCVCPAGETDSLMEQDSWREASRERFTLRQKEITRQLN